MPNKFSQAFRTLAILRIKVVFAIAISAAVFLSACSSSNDGPVLPSEELDSIPPVISNFSPEIEENGIVPFNAIFDITFSELVLPSSISESLSLVSQNARDIYTGIDVAQNFYPSFTRDERELRVDLEEIIVPRLQAEVEEGQGLFLESETLVNRLSVAASKRLALNAYYRLTLSSLLKDRSPVASINPISGAPDTGNFLESDFLTFFGVPDGEWRAQATRFDVSDGNGIQRASFEPSLTAASAQAAAFWLQDYTPNGGGSSLVGIWSSLFDTEKEAWATDDSGNQVFEENLEALSGDAAEPGVDLSSVTDLVAYDDESRVCIAWWQDASVAASSVSRLYLRCAENRVWGKKLLITSISSASSNEDTTVIRVGDQLLISYLSNDRVYNFSVPFFSDVLPDLNAPLVIGGAGADIKEFVVSSSPEGLVNALLNIDQSADSGAALDNRIEFTQIEELNNGLLARGTSTVLKESDSEFSGLSQGYDYLGAGFASWLIGDNSLREYQIARFDGGAWQAPFKMVKDGRGNINAGTLHVFEEGHALIAWVQELGATRELRVTGYFAANGGTQYVIPSFRALLSSSAPITGLGISGDREGNGFVYGVRGSTTAFAFRFSDNSAWRNAWSNLVSIQGSTSISSFGLTPIMKDGRFLAITSALGTTVQELSAKIFTE
jgi:hypothetical protein